MNKKKNAYALAKALTSKAEIYECINIQRLQDNVYWNNLALELLVTEMADLALRASAIDKDPEVFAETCNRIYHTYMGMAAKAIEDPELNGPAIRKLREEA